MITKSKSEAQNPLILRCHRIMEAFAKSNDERDFYLDRMEGFLIYVDLDKPQEELEILETELSKHKDRYCMIPKLTFYETKKIMEGFVNEKVYDIDTKEKLLDIIQSKEARENFLEFIYDHHTEFDKWQQYYQERSRIRIIEWLRNNNFHFVFEEDLDLPKSMIEKLKRNLFDPKASKDILVARKALFSKAKTYYSNEALNPRPKRGRPPKQAAKLEIEPQVTTDIYTTVPTSVRPFLFTPDISSASAITFSAKFEGEDDFLSHRRQQVSSDKEINLEDFNQKLASLRTLSNRWMEIEAAKKVPQKPGANLEAEEEPLEEEDIIDFDLDEESSEEEFSYEKPKKLNGKQAKAQLTEQKAKPVPTKSQSKVKPKKIAPPKPAPKGTTKLKPAPKAKAPLKAAKKPLRSIVNKPKQNTKPLKPLKKISKPAPKSKKR